MSSEDPGMLVQRLALAERELAAGRADIDRLRRDLSHSTRDRRIASIVMGAAVLGVIILSHVASPRAQGGAQVLTVRAPFIVVDAQGKPLMRIDENEGGVRALHVFNPAGNRVASLGGSNKGTGFVSAYSGNMSTGGSGASLRIDDAANAVIEVLAADLKPIATIKKEGMMVQAPVTVSDRSDVPIMRVAAGGGAGSRGISIYNAQGNEAASAFAVDGRGTGSVVAYAGTEKVGGIGAGFGFDDEKNGFLLVQGADRKATLEARRSGMNARAPLLVLDASEKPIVRVQAKGKDPRGVEVLSESGATAASFSADQQGGFIKVLNGSGVAVAGLLANPGGGSLALTGPVGGKSAVSLSVEATGGKVRVFPAAGGPAQAELTADAAGGGVTLYTKSGQPAAVLYARTTGAGQLEINQNGEKLVEAGVNVNGIGLVLAGPGGTAASIPGVPDSYIIGRKPK